ncbi:MAG: hypothetical protein O3B68_21700 [Planctomycetota bacterium]|nr:hypothetical protein [Planctomycetota bacterium]
MVRAIDALKRMNAEPTNGDAYREWLQQSDVVSFLENEPTEDDIVVLASLLPHVFIHGILIPRFTPDAESIDLLLEWNFDATESWGMVGSLENVSIGGPLDQISSPLIQAGEMIVFQRGFEGIRERSRYFELNQKISQVLGLHFMEDRQAWCDLNRHGDIDEVVKIHTIEQPSGKYEGTVITIRRQRLAEFAGAGCYTFLRMFDFTRYRSGSFSGWGDPTREPLPKSDSVFGTLAQCGSTGSYSRGVQIVDVAATQAELHGHMWHSNEKKEYATFIAQDLRHGRVGNFSCDPEQLANYFTPSEHPFEISPAFFRPEVLSKYKADTEKYLIEHRSISCRGSWYLKAFGVNEAGQVHAYLGYLGSLPYEEQLHWKQFNEAPKAGLSDSIIATDFRGEWSEEYEPLLNLKRKLHELDRQSVGWWVLRGEGLPDRVHYPFTDSRDEWGSELMNLDQYLAAR